jgi:hypothetical protein
LLVGTLTTTRSARWVGIVLIVAVGVLQMHLPHYLAATASSTDYAAYPGLLLVATMIGAAAAAVAIGRRRRAGWLVLQRQLLD